MGRCTQGAWALVYTVARVEGVEDSGIKPYSHAENTVEGVYMEATAQIEETPQAVGTKLSGLSRLMWNENSFGFPSATTLTSVEWDLVVVDNGPISLTWGLQGQVIVSVAAFEEYPGPIIAEYGVVISSMWGEYMEFDGIYTDQSGYYYLPVSKAGTFDFGGTSFTAGERVHVLIDLTTTAQAGSGWGSGSTIWTDFEDSLRITALNNLVIPEPGSAALLGLGLLLATVRRKKK